MLKPTRTLATANRSRVSIRVTQKNGQARGRGQPCKISSYTVWSRIHLLFRIHVRACRKSQKFEDASSLGMGGERGWPPRNTLLLHMYYLAEFGRSRLNGSSALTDIRWKKNLAHRVPLFKVIGIDTIRLATCDFLLVIHSNYGPISYRFWDKRRYRAKLEKNPSPVHLTPTLRGFLGFWIVGGT